MALMIKKILVPTFGDDRGLLSALELNEFVGWDVKRVYYVSNVSAVRGGHCVQGEKKIYVCVAGSVRGRFFDGHEWVELDLKAPSDAILMEGDYWREFVDFSDGAVLMAISNMNYEPDKYIYDINQYKEFITCQKS